MTNTNTYYYSGKALKMVEVDNYKEGCLPESAQNFLIDVTFRNETKEEIIEDIKDYFDIEELEINACDEPGRIDFSILENGDGLSASNYEVKEWKEGNIILYHAIYTYQITKVTKEVVKL